MWRTQLRQLPRTSTIGFYNSPFINLWILQSHTVLGYLPIMGFSRDHYPCLPCCYDVIICSFPPVNSFKQYSCPPPSFCFYQQILSYLKKTSFFFNNTRTTWEAVILAITFSKSWSPFILPYMVEIPTYCIEDRLCSSSFPIHLFKSTDGTPTSHCKPFLLNKILIPCSGRRYVDLVSFNFRISDRRFPYDWLCLNLLMNGAQKTSSPFKVMTLLNLFYFFHKHITYTN